MKHLIIIFYLLCYSLYLFPESIPQRVIMFTIDGLNWEAPRILPMNCLNTLRKEGVYIERSCMILPHHPTVGEYGKIQTTSFPNPVLHQGTLFLEPNGKYIQQMWKGCNAQTIFVTNSFAYESITKGFTTIIQDESMSDSEVVEKAKSLLLDNNIKFMRIHLQTPGNEGRFLSTTSPNKPYYRNIYGEGSPYVIALKEADKQLKKLVHFLKQQQLWESTLFIVTSDHGQSRIGWHPITDPDSWKTPLLFIGPGIAKGRELEYFEHTDIIPTICHLMHIELPNNNKGTGHFIPELLEKEKVSNKQYLRQIEHINKQIIEYNMLRSQLYLLSKKNHYYSTLITSMENSIMTPEPFYHQDRFTEWYMSGGIDHLIKVNEKHLENMRNELNVK